MTVAPPVLPGATLGVFGGGQLGRMFAQAAMRLGYRVIVFSPTADSPAGDAAHELVVAPFDDESAVRGFARRCQALTLEFENVPVRTAELASEHAPVRPGPGVLAPAQDRLLERAFLDAHGLPCAPHASVRSAADVAAARERLGDTVVLKSARLGYDGRGQARLDPGDDGDAAWRGLNVDAALCESWVTYACEVSVLAARSVSGAIETFGPIRNDHVNHILDVSVAPAGLEPALAREATDLARATAEAADLVGVICVEMFVTADGLLVNELAPRPHNSGHLTIEACTVSQFEQQVRTMCGLPPAPMTLRQPAAMANLLGDLWTDGEPDWAGVLAHPSVALHLYGKTAARPGRKMGHLTALGDTPEGARRRVSSARDTLRGSGAPHSTDPSAALR